MRPRKNRSKTLDDSKESSKPKSKDPKSNSVPAEDVNSIKKTQSSAKSNVAATTADSDFNYLVLVSNVFTFDPTISRLLSPPCFSQFGKFHQVLQIAFGWANCHMHQFTVKVNIPCEKKGHKHADGGKVWLPRRVMTLQSPATIMEESVEEFRTEDETKWTLNEILERKEWDGHTVSGIADLQLLYEYDMGNGWEHQINVLDRVDKSLHTALTVLPLEKAQQVLCIAGEGHLCAEDCGSELGWEDLKKDFKKSRGDEERKDWYKIMCANGDLKGLDPWKWDILDVNEQLERIKA